MTDKDKDKKKKGVSVKSSAGVTKKAKTYNVTTSKNTKSAEQKRGTHGRNQSNREDAFKKDIKAAGGIEKYVTGLNAAKKKAAKNSRY